MTNKQYPVKKLKFLLNVFRLTEISNTIYPFRDLNLITSILSS